MVAQTQIAPTNGNSSPPQAFVRNTGELVSDAMTLAELQGQLLVIDFKDDLQRLLWPIGFLVAGAIVALGCLPIVLVTLALGIMAGTGWPPWLAFLTSLSVGLVLAAGLIGGAIWQLRSGLTFLVRSRSEWQQNLAWFKSLVRRLGKSTNRPAEPGT